MGKGFCVTNQGYCGKKRNCGIPYGTSKATSKGVTIDQKNEENYPM